MCITIHLLHKAQTMPVWHAIEIMKFVIFLRLEQEEPVKDSDT